MYIFGKKSGLKPDLGFWELFLMAVSGTLGAGLFVLLGQGAALAGPLLPLSFMGAGVIAFLISQVYAELATSMPASGGGQVYIRTAFGHHPGLFLGHWLIWIAEIAFTALNALGLGVYLSLIIPLNSVLIAVLAVFLVTGLNLFGVKRIGKIEIGVALLLLLALFGMLTLLVKDFSGADLSWKETSLKVGPLGWIQAIPLIFIIFIGNEDIAAIAAEVKNKQKNIPKVLTFTVLTLTLITALFSFFFVHSFPLAQVAGTSHPFSLMGKQLGPLGRNLAISVAVLACFSSMFLGSLADTRTSLALAKAGEFPKIFSKLNRHQVPFFSILTSGFLVFFLCLTETATEVAYVANIGFFLECILVSFASIELRKKRPHLPRPFLVRPFPLIPISVIVLCVPFLLGIQLRAWITAALFSVVGFLVYLVGYFKKEKVILALKGIGVFLLCLILAFLLLFTLTLQPKISLPAIR